MPELEEEIGGTPPEDLAEWLERMDIPLEATATVEKLRDWLGKNINLPAGMVGPSEAQVGRAWQALDNKYRYLPELGISYERVYQPRWFGYQGIFRSLDPRITGVRAGAFISPVKVKELTGW